MIEKNFNILIACEESQRVCTAFRERGFNAFSCDILPPSGGHPEWHIMDNVISVLEKYCNDAIFFQTLDKAWHTISKWDLIIAHPPCTYLTATGNRWFSIEKYGEKALKRFEQRAKAAAFFVKIANADCNHIAIENPVGFMNTHFRKPNQIIQPYMFGDAFEKTTCLWLKNLPLLNPTNVVEPPPRTKYASGKTMPAWYADAWKLPPDERSRIRSQTFPGIARAMAEQWGDFITGNATIDTFTLF